MALLATVLLTIGGATPVVVAAKMLSDMLKGSLR
jgi:hypothetical protein